MKDIEFCWWCPSAGTQDFLASGQLAQIQSFDYISEVAKKCEEFGFNDILIPTSQRCLDPIIVATTIGAQTKHLNLMIAVRPGQWTPVHFARTFSSLNFLYKNRLKINYIEGRLEDAMNEGDLVDADRRPKRKNEFIEIVESLLTKGSINYDGQHYKIKNATIPKLLTIENLQCMNSGHSRELFNIAVKYNYRNLVYGASIKKIRATVKEIKSLNKKNVVDVGMAIQVFARETKAEAEKIAFNFISRISLPIRDKASQFNNENPIVEGIHYKTLEAQNYWYDDVLWYGLMKGKTHQRASLVGSYEDVARALIKYTEAGISYFIITADPNFDELIHFGKNILPLFHCSRQNQTMPVS